MRSFFIVAIALRRRDRHALVLQHLIAEPFRHLYLRLLRTVEVVRLVFQRNEVYPQGSKVGALPKSSGEETILVFKSNGWLDPLKFCFFCYQRHPLSYAELCVPHASIEAWLDDFLVPTAKRPAERFPHPCPQYVH